MINNIIKSNHNQQNTDDGDNYDVIVILISNANDNNTTTIDDDYNNDNMKVTIKSNNNNMNKKILTLFISIRAQRNIVSSPCIRVLSMASDKRLSQWSNISTSPFAVDKHLAVVNPR